MFLVPWPILNMSFKSSNCHFSWKKKLQNIITIKQRNFFLWEYYTPRGLVARALAQYSKSFPLAASLRLIFIFIYFISGRSAFIAYHSTDLHFSSFVWFRNGRNIFFFFFLSLSVPSNNCNLITKSVPPKRMRKTRKRRQCETTTSSSRAAYSYFPLSQCFHRMQSPETERKKETFSP